MNRDSAEIILSDLKERGCFYYDGRTAYFFFETNKNLMVIDRDNQDLELVLIKYGVAPSETLFRYVIDALRLEAMENGQRTEVHFFTYYDRSSNNLYVFNFGQQVYRITADGIEQVDNGTDGVLFQHNPMWTPFKTVEPDSDRSAFNDIIPITANDGWIFLR